MTLFLDVQNLYDRKNERGAEIETIYGGYTFPSGEVAYVRRNPENWGGMMPSFGISWEF